MYSVKQTFGGFIVVDDEDIEVGDEIFSGTGAKARAQAEADKLNGVSPASESQQLEETPVDQDVIERGRGRGGRGA